uniref:Uncharacterized protein n=1 Tax=Spongospora subterranea TaxID=70186 RepID=A0A0H5R2V4_9EUKA|eukprot:CRZ08538.1 hypothetical protein [Spongospora subterranea]
MKLPQVISDRSMDVIKLLRTDQQLPRLATINDVVALLVPIAQCNPHPYCYSLPDCIPSFDTMELQKPLPSNMYTVNRIDRRSRVLNSHLKVFCLIYLVVSLIMSMVGVYF